MHTLRLTNREDISNAPNKAGYVMDSEIEAGRKGESLPLIHDIQFIAPAKKEITSN